MAAEVRSGESRSPIRYTRRNRSSKIRSRDESEYLVFTCPSDELRPSEANRLGELLGKNDTTVAAVYEFAKLSEEALA